MAIKKPFLEKENMEKKLRYDTLHKNLTGNQWQQV